MAGMNSLPMYMQGAGTVLSTFGQVQQGIAADQAARFRARQLEQQAGQARASSQQAMLQERRRERLVQSRLQAVAGGGGLDVGVVELSKGIAAEGEYRALSALYEGEEAARGMEAGAAAARIEGKQARTAGMLRAASTVMSGATSLYEQYGQNRRYNYNDDEDGMKYSRTGADIRRRR
jgi:hypothetical protein